MDTLFTETEQLAESEPLVTVTVSSPEARYFAENEAVLPDVGVPFGADQEYEPVPFIAVKVAICSTLTVCVAGEQESAGEGGGGVPPFEPPPPLVPPPHPIVTRARQIRYR
jgi:hypothetical protein